LIWAVSRVELPQRIKQKIHGEKGLGSILWLVNGIQSLLVVTKGTTYNTAFFTDAVMSSLIESVRSHARRKMLKDWLIHMDNARPHNSQRAQRCIDASRTEPLPHAACSPDLAAGDFFIFTYFKGKPSDYNYKSREDLLNVITEIFTGVDQEVVLNVLES
jgi:hypothetical protein